MGVLIETDKINLTTSLNIKDNNNNFIGELRSACYSPHFKKVIGIAMINQPYCKASESGIIEIDGNSLSLKVCDLPFI
jgi:dimethylsulfoniopropionate demethylase